MTIKLAFPAAIVVIAVLTTKITLVSVQAEDAIQSDVPESPEIVRIIGFNEIAQPPQSVAPVTEIDAVLFGVADDLKKNEIANLPQSLITVTLGDDGQKQITAYVRSKKVRSALIPERFIALPSINENNEFDGLTKEIKGLACTYFTNPPVVVACEEPHNGSNKCDQS